MNNTKYLNKINLQINKIMVNVCSTIMTMIMVNIHEAKAKISEYIEAAARGEQVVICNRNRPVVELRPIVAARTSPRPIGGGPHRYDVSDEAFAPLGDAELDEWDRGSVYPRHQPEASRGAERHDGAHGGAPKKRR